MKSIVVKIQEQELYKRMLVSSKMDGVLINGFSYDGKVKKYLLELDSVEAQAQNITFVALLILMSTFFTVLDIRT